MTTHIGDIFAKLFILGSNPVTSTRSKDVRDSADKIVQEINNHLPADQQIKMQDRDED